MADMEITIGNLTIVLDVKIAKRVLQRITERKIRDAQIAKEMMGSDYVNTFIPKLKTKTNIEKAWDEYIS